MFSLLKRFWIIAIFLAAQPGPLAAQTQSGRNAPAERPLNLPGTTSPLDFLLMLEQTANFDNYRQPTEPVKIRIRSVDADRVELSCLGGPCPKRLEAFLHPAAGKVAVPAHPTNTSPDVPFVDVPFSGSVEGHHTASRSMVVKELAVSLKMPTDHPTAGQAQPDPGKANLKGDVLAAMPVEKHILEVEKLHGPSELIGFLHEIAVVRDRATGNGYLVRDLTPLLDGHYYVDGKSLITHTGSLAEYNGYSGKPGRLKFAEEKVAEAIGRIQARLLIDYGITLVFPHGQNFLFQTDEKLRFTGKIIFRDSENYRLVREVVESMGLGSSLTELEAATSASAGSSGRVVKLVDGHGMKTAVPKLNWGSVSTNLPEDLWLEPFNHLVERQRAGFVSEIRSALGLQDLSPKATPSEVCEFLASERGRAPLRQYHAKRKAAWAAKNAECEDHLTGKFSK